MSTPEPNYRFRVAIIGAGIGGLCLASGLSQFSDIAFDIYEGHDDYDNLGAGIYMYGRSDKALDGLGVAKELAEIGAKSDFLWNLRKSDVASESRDLGCLELTPSGAAYQRSQFLRVLVNRVPPGRVHFNKKLASYSEDSGTVTIRFSDGTTSSCDVLVGADGIKSMTRRVMYNLKLSKDGLSDAGRREVALCIEPRFTGTLAYRGAIPMAKLNEAMGGNHSATNQRVVFCGKNLVNLIQIPGSTSDGTTQHIIAYPIHGPKLVNVNIYATNPLMQDRPWKGAWVDDVSPSEVVEVIQGYEEEALAIAKCLGTNSRWAIHELRPLPFYVSGRVALLGDSAHAMTPHQGAGANQAAEDAYILSHLLGSMTTSKTLPLALAAYERIRLPRANRIIKTASDSGDCLQFRHHDDCERMFKEIDQMSQILFEGDPEDDLNWGLAWLEECSQ